MAGCCAEPCTAPVLIGVMRLPGCPFDSAGCLVCQVCRLTVDCVDFRCFLSFIFLGGARRLELSPCVTQTISQAVPHAKKEISVCLIWWWCWVAAIYCCGVTQRNLQTPGPTYCWGVVILECVVLFTCLGGAARLCRFPRNMQTNEPAWP